MDDNRNPLLINDLNHTLCGPQWNKVGIKHHHGLCLPLFSLRTHQSAGIGEYLDLIPLIEWCSHLGIDILQFLPLNDNGKGTSPYSAISAFALNPLHISLSHFEKEHADPELSAIYQELQSKNQEPRVQYEAVAALKERFLRGYFAKFRPSIDSDQEFLTFKVENAWLLPYGVFRSLKEKTQWASWQNWQDDWRQPSEQDFNRLAAENTEEIEYHSFLQFLCHSQLSFVKAEAGKQNVLLKGDIPILISKESADVWHHPSVFDTSYSAGAPPDMYNAMGQDWGFPLYNWEALDKNGYDWWVQRLHMASKYFDLYRIDHIVGFYRIWAIHPEFPSDFIPKDEALWINHGEKILKHLVSSSSMLPIGEDLGTVPPEVRRNLRALGISGTKVMRWERKWEEDKSFIPFNEYEPLSMTTVSTHDSDTLKLWWKLHPDEAEEFSRFKGWQFEPELTYARHYEILNDSHSTSSLFHINLLQEYLALFPGMTWENPEDERVNLPGTISEKNWSYKLRPSLEEIIGNESLGALLQDLAGKTPCT